MAEERKYGYSTRGRVAGGVINTLKTFGNMLGGRFHYYRTADLELVPRKRLKDAIDLLGGRIKELTHVEAQYRYVEKTLGPDIEDIYKEIGFYTDVDLIDEERRLLGSGTGIKKETIDIDGKEQEFEIPDEKELKFPDSYVERISYFGYNQKATWQKRYIKFIERVCKDKIDKINGDKSLTPEQKDNMIDVVNKVIKKSYLTVLPQLFAGISEKGSAEGIPENISAKEKAMESFLYKLKEHYFKRLSSLRGELYKNMPDKVRYKHTYKVVDLSKIPDPPGWVDENGMPLEVATTGYEFDGIKYGGGDVLLDIFNKSTTIRNVPKGYIKDLPLIEVVNYVHCEWDEYRDDLRDGRYHPESLTVMDYIMAANPAIGYEWKNKLKPLSIGPEEREYKMRLGNGEVITHQRIATNLNPAFDLRAFKREGGRYWRYIGKKKYYEHADNACVDEQHDPHITTRGLSMFIIETICRQGKNLREIHEELIDVGKETGGFDYGPRRFGGAFCKDPFDIDLTGATESVMSSPIITGPPKES